MTAKNIGGESIAGDRYYTPRWCVDLCLEHILPTIYGKKRPHPKSILEPGAGEGVFVEALAEKYPQAIIHAFDLDWKEWPKAKGSACLDFMKQDPDSELIERIRLKLGTPKTQRMDRYDLVIGNPPYTNAMGFTERSLILGEHVVFILRQGFLASVKRAKFFRENPPVSVWNQPNRPSFTGDGSTDTADYCWVVWRRGYMDKTSMHWLPEVPKELRK